MDLETTIDKLPKVGPIFQKRLNQLGIRTIRDLLWYFPQRYEDFSSIMPIAKIRLNEKACLCGKVLEIETTRTWKKKMFVTEAVIQDETAAVRAVWFNQPYLSSNLKQGDEICLAGKVSLDDNGVFLSNPSYEKVWETENLTHTGRIIPVYPETKGVSSRYLRWIIKAALQDLRGKLTETLPDEIVKTENLLGLNEAIRQIHFPDTFSQAQKAKERLVFEELFLIEIAVLRLRWLLHKEKSMPVPFNLETTKKFVASLNFKLTDSQRKCAFQILKDMEKQRPMSRLLEGDVGSGKTVVAVLAILNVVKAGYQTAFMAPTEILAKQHFIEVAKLLKPFKVRIALLTGKQDKIIAQKLGHKTKTGFLPDVLEISRAKLLEKTKGGEIDVLIGTHALIQDTVKFAPSPAGLALAIIDEQHRFGVKQRAKLVAPKTGQKKLLCHLLSMTATPIPRTLALTLYGNLDLSLLTELPKGRKKIETKVVSPEQRKGVYDFIRKEAKKGNQTFIICPRIEAGEENEKLSPKKALWAEVKAVEEEHKKLSENIFKDLKVAMLHGKMKTAEKEKIMRNFKAKKIDILVSTSVIEVGVDIPQATVMMIESAERFGLAQLHQFRGRVGRADKQSYCFLFTESKSQNTKSRLRAIITAKNGFELAEKDLAIRGPGSLSGLQQWGLPDLAMEGLKDIKLVEKTREWAKSILQESPNLVKYPLLRQFAVQFEKKTHLE